MIKKFLKQLDVDVHVIWPDRFDRQHRQSIPYISEEIFSKIVIKSLVHAEVTWYLQWDNLIA